MSKYLKGAQVLGAVVDQTSDQARGRDNARKIWIGTGIASLACTVAGAVLWKKHRVLGALIGGFLVGPPAGMIATLPFLKVRW